MRQIRVEFVLNTISVYHGVIGWKWKWNLDYMTHFEICVNRKRFIPKNYFEQNFTFKIDYFED